jgi:hypothetical protein
VPEPLIVDTAALKRAGDFLDPPAVRLRKALADFMATAAEVGERPWGTDSTGQAIEKAYVESKVGNVLASVQNLTDGVDVTRFRVWLMAEGYSATEAANSM